MSIHKLPSGGYMEADRLIEAGKDIAAIKATVDPLLTTLNENTKAVTELTYQVRSLVDIYQSQEKNCLLYTSPSPRDRQKSRMPSSA